MDEEKTYVRIGVYTMVEKYYTPKQVAEILQIHPYTVLKWIREGRLPALKFGRVYRTTESELTKFLGSTSRHQPVRTSTQMSMMHEAQSAGEMHSAPEVQRNQLQEQRELEEAVKVQDEFEKEKKNGQEFYILEPPSLT